MIVRSLCNTCLQRYEILIQASDVGLVKQVTDDGYTAPCPRLCGGRINMAGDSVIDALQSHAQLKDAISLTGLELYRAVNGAGLPDEVSTDPVVVESMLKANRITGVELEEINGRVYLHELRLENGVVVHLGAGSPGARVIKITKERPHGTAPRS